MFVKICANTNVEDARLAAELGADAVGFVFAPSQRQVTAGEVRAITARLADGPGAGIERWGVFAGGDVGEIAGVVREAGLTGVQLHAELRGAEEERLRELVGDGVRVVPVVHWDVGEGAGSAERVRGRLRGMRAGSVVLLDAKKGGASGGLGVALDWGAARAVFGEFPGIRVVLAGGLRMENVAEAIRVFGPWGVDVASGVERVPGRKDGGRLRGFLEAVREQDQERSAKFAK